MNDDNITVTPVEDITPDPTPEVSPEVIVDPNTYYTDVDLFEASQMQLDGYQYRDLQNQKSMIGLIFVISLELIIVILLLCRRRK